MATWIKNLRSAAYMYSRQAPRDPVYLSKTRGRLAPLEDCLMGMKKDEQFLVGKKLGGRPAIVESRITAPVKPHKPKVLTPQEWKFVEEFCAGDGHVTLKEAALRAGYSENWAKNRARELTDPDMQPARCGRDSGERRSELGEKYGTTFERHMRDLQVIRDQALTAGAYGAAVQAEYRRGQALGTIYIDRKEIRHGTIDSMSKEEVQRKLEEIGKYTETTTAQLLT
jgi:hypothetical protein